MPAPPPAPDGPPPASPSASVPQAPIPPAPAPVPLSALAWALLPPLAVLLLRAWLQARLGDADPMQPLRLADQVTSVAQAFWLASRPFAGAALGLLAAWLGARAALRRWGWARLRPGAQALWALVWMAAGAALLAVHLNQTGRQPLPAATARVALAREVAPGKRHAGGAELYLQGVPGSGADRAEAGDAAAPVHRLLAEGRTLADFPQGSAVTLTLERGRWWGRWASAQPAAPE